MTTLVTGGTGFLGRHLVARLLERGERVRVLSRSFDLELADLGVEIVEGSLEHHDDVRRATDGARVVYHLAGRVERDPEMAHLMYQVHVDGTRRLLDALVEHGQVERVVYASTSGVVGVGAEPSFIADDDSPYVETLVRRWPYYLSKIYAERVCRRFVDEHQLPLMIMRPTLLLGPGDRHESSTGDVVNFLRRRIPSTPSGGLSFVDVRDVADAFVAAAERGIAGESYLLGACNLTLAKFFRRLEHLSNVPAPKLPIPDDLAKFGAKLLDRAARAVGASVAIDPVSVEMGQYHWYIDWEKAEDELGFRPRNPNDTLRDTIRWIRAHHPEFAVGTERRSLEAIEAPNPTLDWLEDLKAGRPE